MGVTDLLADLSHTTPDLPGARCVGKWELYDLTAAGHTMPRATVVQAQHDALELCRHCPVLQACEEWLAGLPPYRRPRSVVAGRMNTYRNAGGRRRPEGG